MDNGDFIRKRCKPGDRIRKRNREPYGGESNGVIEGVIERIATPNYRGSILNQLDIVADDGKRCQLFYFCEWNSQHDDPEHGVELVTPATGTVAATHPPTDLHPAAALLIREGVLTAEQWRGACAVKGVA